MVQKTVSAQFRLAKLFRAPLGVRLFVTVCVGVCVVSVSWSLFVFRSCLCLYCAAHAHDDARDDDHDEDDLGGAAAPCNTSTKEGAAVMC